MANPFGVPEIDVFEVNAKRKAGEPFVWIDVREPEEVAQVAIPDPQIHRIPLSQIASQQLAALPPTLQDKDAEIIVFCHHGMRSAKVAAWLQQQGWRNVKNMTGGIGAWADEIDESIGRY